MLKPRGPAPGWALYDWALDGGMAMPASPRSMRPSVCRPFDLQPLEPRTLLSIAPAWPEVRANTTVPGEQQTLTAHKSVASNAAGDFVAIWESDQFGANGLVFGQRFNAAGVKQGGEFVITPFHHR